MSSYKLTDLEDFRSETPQAFFKLVDGILSIDLKNESIIDLTTVQRIEHFRREMTMNTELPVIISIPNDYLLLDNAAFKYLGSKEAMSGCIAKAIVIKAPLRVILTNFSLSFYNQGRPFRIFASKNDAKMWLFSHLNVDEFMAAP